MLKKIKFFLYNRFTFMLIPTDSEEVVSLHISKLTLMLIPIVFLIILTSGLVSLLYLEKKERVLNYYKEERAYYRHQLSNFSSFLPKISEKQEDVSYKIASIFHSLKVKIPSDPVIRDGRVNIYKEKLCAISDYVKGFRKLFLHMPSIFPLVTRRFWFTSPFGWRIHPITGRRQFHTGQDIAAFPGTPVRATASGVVTEAGWKGGYGIVVTIKHGFGYKSRYAHLSRLNVYRGQYVRRGRIIGYVGSTGVSTGYHLHYEIILNDKFLNPRPFLYLDHFGRY